MIKMSKRAKRDNVIVGLKAIGATIDNMDEIAVDNLHTKILNDLRTQKEKDAFNYGTLAVLSDVGKRRLKRFYYTHKFKKAMREL